jgi:hypothetical protein
LGLRPLGQSAVIIEGTNMGASFGANAMLRPIRVLLFIETVKGSKDGRYVQTDSSISLGETLDERK